MIASDDVSVSRAVKGCVGTEGDGEPPASSVRPVHDRSTTVPNVGVDDKAEQKLRSPSKRAGREKKERTTGITEPHT